MADAGPRGGLDLQGNHQSRSGGASAGGVEPAERAVAQAFNVPPSSVGQVEHQSRSTVIDETRRLVSLSLAPLAARVGDALGQLLLSPQERAQGIRVAINLESLVRGYGLELSEALSRYVLAGVLSRNEARRTLGYPGRSDGDALRQPVNVEITDQAQSRQDRADATAEANIAAANSNEQIAAQIDELRRELAPKEPDENLFLGGTVSQVEDGVVEEAAE
jgi:Phage portal protein